MSVHGAHPDCSASSTAWRRPTAGLAQRGPDIAIGCGRRWRPFDATAPVAAIVFSALGAAAQSTEPERASDEAPAGVGAWGGLRPWLQERGVIVGLGVITDASVVASGGVDTGAAAIRSLWGLDVLVDTAPLFGFGGGTIYAELQVQQGRDGSLDTGDAQIYSNIDGPDRAQLARIWYEHSAWNGGLTVRVGKMDANDQFAFVEHGTVHLHSSFGFPPTILGFPSYPDPSFGATLAVRPGQGTYARAGVFDGATVAGIETGPRGPGSLFGAPADLFVVAEGGLRWSQHGRPGRVGFGGWQHTGEFDRGDGSVQNGLDGLYLVVDQVLWRPHEAAPHANVRGLGAFLQYGWSDPDGTVFEQYCGAGGLWTGPLAQRPDDQLGCGLAWLRWREDPGGGIRGGGEVALEVFYRAQVTSWLSLLSDVQWIHDPGGRPELDDALVLTLRIEARF